MNEPGIFPSFYDLSLSKQSLIKINKEPVINYYEILNKLGIGSFGKVKIVRYKKFNDFGAMKIVNKKLNSSTNEIEIFRKISHPNIVNIYEIFEYIKKYYMITEFCKGSELF